MYGLSHPAPIVAAAMARGRLPNPGRCFMTQDDLAMLRHQPLRGTDSNSLLRLYDHAKFVLATSHSCQQREWADRAVRRVAAELQRRRVRT
jgi:hypothetical protein